MWAALEERSFCCWLLDKVKKLNSVLHCNFCQRSDSRLRSIEVFSQRWGSFSRPSLIIIDWIWLPKCGRVSNSVERRATELTDKVGREIDLATEQSARSRPHPCAQKLQTSLACLSARPIPIHSRYMCADPIRFLCGQVSSSFIKSRTCRSFVCNRSCFTCPPSSTLTLMVASVVFGEEWIKESVRLDYSS